MGGERAVLGARDGRGGWPKAGHPAPGHARPRTSGSFFGQGSARFFFWTANLAPKRGGGLRVEVWRVRRDTWARVRGVYSRGFSEYGCNPAEPPSGRGSLAGRAAAARTALRKTHIDATDTARHRCRFSPRTTHHAPRTATHPCPSVCSACKRVPPPSLPRRTHARRASSSLSRRWRCGPRAPSERRAAPRVQGLGLRA